MKICNKKIINIAANAVAAIASAIRVSLLLKFSTERPSEKLQLVSTH